MVRIVSKQICCFILIWHRGRQQIRLNPAILGNGNLHLWLTSTWLLQCTFYIINTAVCWASLQIDFRFTRHFENYGVMMAVINICFVFSIIHREYVFASTVINSLLLMKLEILIRSRFSKNIFVPLMVSSSLTIKETGALSQGLLDHRLCWNGYLDWPGSPNQCLVSIF